MVILMVMAMVMVRAMMVTKTVISRSRILQQENGNLNQKLVSRVLD